MCTKDAVMMANSTELDESDLRRDLIWICTVCPNLSVSLVTAGRGSSDGSATTWCADGRRFDPHVKQHSFVEFGLEIISTAILSLPLIQEGQLSLVMSVTGEKNVH